MGMLDRLEGRNLRSSQAALAKLGRSNERALAQTVVRPSIDRSSEEFRPRLLPVLGGAVLLATDRALHLMRRGALVTSLLYVGVEDFHSYGSTVVVDLIKYPRTGNRIRLWMDAEHEPGSLPDIVVKQLQSYDDIEITYARPYAGEEGRVSREAWRPESPARIDMSVGGLYPPNDEEIATAVRECLMEAERQRRQKGTLGP